MPRPALFILLFVFKKRDNFFLALLALGRSWFVGDSLFMLSLVEYEGFCDLTPAYAKASSYAEATADKLIGRRQGMKVSI